MTPYASFLAARRQHSGDDGFDPTFIPAAMQAPGFEFQSALLEWACRKGRAAVFADCGLGKTPLQLAWAENVQRHTGKPVLVLAPLAVAQQAVREGEKFGIECARSGDGRVVAPITVANYERLHLFDPAAFAGVVCDESSILKNFDGVRRGAITAFMRKMRYRLLCTATAAPNDYTELGTSSEALGYLGHMDMLSRFFVNADRTSKARKYLQRGSNFADIRESAAFRLKGHAEEPFWRWVCSWARALRKPSDLGFDDTRFVLPPLIEREHVVEAKTLPDGFLFAVPAVGLKEQREELRRTLKERCYRIVELVSHDKPVVCWTQLNDEADLLEAMIPDAVQVSGKDSDDYKEGKFLDFAAGNIRVLVTKPKIGALGLNWQHCAHMTFFPSHSFEQYYQGVRRCWRFGQERPVTVDIVTTEGGLDVLKNLQRKTVQADAMFSRLVALMQDHLDISPGQSFPDQERMPKWL
jgi:hypothetical protein